LPRGSAFPNQLGIRQLANARPDLLNVNVLVSVFPGVMHLGILARDGELFGEKRFA
jgi:hypothetical protein